jgi:hypothetical protein
MSDQEPVKEKKEKKEKTDPTKSEAEVEQTEWKYPEELEEEPSGGFFDRFRGRGKKKQQPPEVLVTTWQDTLKEKGYEQHAYGFPQVAIKKAQKSDDPLVPVYISNKPGHILIAPLDKELNSEEILVKEEKITNLVTPSILQIDRDVFLGLSPIAKKLIPKFITLRGYEIYHGEPFTRDSFTTEIVNHRKKYEWLVEREILEPTTDPQSHTGYKVTEKYQEFILKRHGEPIRILYDVSDIDYMRAQQGAMVENDTLVHFAAAMKKDPDEANKKMLLWVVLGSFITIIVIVLVMLQSFTGNIY